MKMTEKTKKYLAIGGGAVICIALIAAISLQFGKAPAGEDVLPEESPSATDIVIDPGNLPTETDEGKTEPVIQPNTDTAGNASQAADSRPAQTDQTEQSIQPEVTKPAEPEESVKTDSTQKPDGTKVDTPPTPVDHEEVVKPSEPTPAPDQPQGGETQDGKIYLPGFGWVTDTGSNGTTAGDMYENGNKIGSMD
jgi:hypothetical protein